MTSRRRASTPPATLTDNLYSGKERVWLLYRKSTAAKEHFGEFSGKMVIDAANEFDWENNPRGPLDIYSSESTS